MSARMRLVKVSAWNEMNCAYTLCTWGAPTSPPIFGQILATFLEIKYPLLHRCNCAVTSTRLALELSAVPNYCEWMSLCDMYRYFNFAALVITSQFNDT